MRAITDALPALISFFDADHVCRFANAYHAQWYGRTPEDLIGRHMRDFLGDAAYASRREHLDRVATGEHVSFDARVPHLDGSWRDAAIRYVPKMGAHGFEGMYILVFDVAVQQHRFHSVFHGTAVGFWIVDLAGVQSLLDGLGMSDNDALIDWIESNPGFSREALDATRVLDINAKASELFGTSPEGARGQPFSRWFPETSLPAFKAKIVAFLSGASSFEVETVMTAAGGRSLHVLLTCAFAKNAPGETAVVIGTTDISHRILKEQELSRAQADLAHAARVATLGELVASIAHEVKQPLAAIVTNGNAALRWLNRAKPDPDEAQDAIRRMVSEGARASEIISRTRAMAIKGDRRLTRFALNAMIEEAVSIVQGQLAVLGARLMLDLESRMPEVVGDRIQLQQVVINLVVNAAQAMAGQREDARTITIRSRGDAAVVSVEVVDTGSGVAADQMSRLFDAFYTTKPDGMGMGLSVTRTIVESHGGSIVVRSPDEGGASFLVTIPVTDIETYDNGRRMHHAP
ncbi:hypothetical protein BK022_11760 [Methylorubrum extorquens]|uniref:histidine kinase n=1 Tax=Methylorubrum extorquens TaxID=408 RepID=A0A1S1P4D4_METEX|nr:hypothetical protein BK022_11760 [Methylorubrum extorquens]